MASLLILKKGKVSSLGEKVPAPNYENLIQNRLLREDNLRRRECEDHFLDSFVTQAEIEGFVVALDGSVAEDLYSHAKQKHCCIPHICEYLDPQGKDDSGIL